MRRAQIVVGSGYGDEGKGLVTDWLCGKGADLCIRYHSGSQAGHTVRYGGQRHVFSHFGSGTYRSVPTYLGSNFISNPLIWAKELQEFKNDGFHRFDIRASSFGKVTTPYDMLINQAIEEHRGDKRHGSVGYGIHETMLRCQDPAMATAMRDLTAPRTLLRKLRQIRDVYVPKRLAELGIEVSGTQLQNEFVIEKYMDLCDKMMSAVPISVSMPETDSITAVYEGAQGLALSERYGVMPHCTPSDPGIHVLDAGELARYDEIEVYYVTRFYATRHGAGPLPFEAEIGSFADETNGPGEYQGRIRFAPLEIDKMGTRIRSETRLLRNRAKHARISSNLVVTWMDKFTDHFPIVIGGTMWQRSADQAVAEMAVFSGCDNVFCAYGDEAKDVIEHSKIYA